MFSPTTSTLWACLFGFLTCRTFRPQLVATLCLSERRHCSRDKAQTAIAFLYRRQATFIIINTAPSTRPYGYIGLIPAASRTSTSPCTTRRRDKYTLLTNVHQLDFVDSNQSPAIIILHQNLRSCRPYIPLLLQHSTRTTITASSGHGYQVTIGASHEICLPSSKALSWGTLCAF